MESSSKCYANGKQKMWSKANWARVFKLRDDNWTVRRKESKMARLNGGWVGLFRACFHLEQRIWVKLRNTGSNTEPDLCSQDQSVNENFSSWETWDYWGKRHAMGEDRSWLGNTGHIQTCSMACRTPSNPHMGANTFVSAGNSKWSPEKGRQGEVGWRGPIVGRQSRLDLWAGGDSDLIPRWPLTCSTCWRMEQTWHKIPGTYLGKTNWGRQIINFPRNV